MYKIVILHIWISSVEIDFKHLKYVYIIRICLYIIDHLPAVSGGWEM